MAERALDKRHAQVSLAVTGVAGPTKDNSGKPIGTIWFAWAQINGPTLSECLWLRGSWNKICKKSVRHSLKRLFEILEKHL